MKRRSNKDVPELRFKEFQDKLSSTVFKKVVLSNHYGPRFNANDYDIDGNVKTIRGTDVALNGEIRYEQVPIASLDFDFIKSHILKDGDLVMITTADCGLTGVFREQEIDYIPSAYAVKITLNEIGNSQYFKFFFQTDYAKSEIRSFIRKATVANLPCSDILRIKLQLPSVKEQEKIAGFLDAIATHLTQLRRKHELLQTYKRGVMQKVFSQQIRFKQDDGTPFPAWEKKKLGELLTIRYGKDHKELEDGKYPVLGTGGIIRYANAYLYDKPSILIGRKGTIDRPQFVTHPFWTVDTLFYSEIHSEVIPFFLFLVVQSINWQKYNEATGVPSLNTTSINSIKVEVPRLKKEQEKIANMLDSINQKIEAIEQKIEGVEKFKQGLLQKMFV